MISVLIFAVDAKLRRTLEQLPKRDTDIRIVDIADDQQSFVTLADKSHVDVVLTQEVPTEEQFTSLRVRDWPNGFVLFVLSSFPLLVLQARLAVARSGHSERRCPCRMTDARVEAFLADVLALEGENPDAIREGIHVARTSSKRRK